MTDQPHQPASPDETPTVPAPAAMPPAPGFVPQAYPTAPVGQPVAPAPQPVAVPVEPAPHRGSHVGWIIGAVVGGVLLLGLAFGSGGVVGWVIGTHHGVRISSAQQVGEQGRDLTGPNGTLQKREQGERKVAPGQTKQNKSGSKKGGTTTPTPTPSPTL